jgi:hypothetical protein
MLTFSQWAKKSLCCQPEPEESKISSLPLGEMHAEIRQSGSDRQ